MHTHRVYWLEKQSVSVERNIKQNIPDYIFYSENYPTPLQIQALPPPPPRSKKLAPGLQSPDTPTKISLAANGCTASSATPTTPLKSTKPDYTEVRRGLPRHLLPRCEAFQLSHYNRHCRSQRRGCRHFRLQQRLPQRRIGRQRRNLYETARYECEGEQVKHLRKSLYGLKPAGRKWYDTICHALTELGLRVNDADPGVFTYHINNETTILAIHVNDCLITDSSTNLISDYKQMLNERPLTNLGPVHWLLGITITHDREARSIPLSNTNTHPLPFSLGDAKSLAGPISPSITLSKADAPSDVTETAHTKKIPYREAVGSLTHAAVATRPDITFAISTLSRFLENPGLVHWEAVNRFFRYLADTKTHALTYGNEHHDLLSYTDADGASQDHRRAFSGYVFLIDDTVM